MSDDAKKSTLEKLMKINYSYPEPSDPNIQSKIYQKREFYFHKLPDRPEMNNYEDIREYRNNICGREFALHEHQSFLANFINPDTPYRGLLLFHGTGSGKTCAAISTAEKFKPIVQKYNPKIYVLVSGPLIKESWKNELIKCTGETYMKYVDKSLYLHKKEEEKAKKNALNSALQYYRFISYRGFYRRVLGEKIKEEKKSTDDKVKVGYRKTETGEFERDISVDRIYNLNNSMIIIDEAHNLTGNMYGDALNLIIKKSTNLRVLLLTATPMKNLADDIIELINFLKPPGKKLHRDKIFNSYKNHQMDFKDGGLETFKRLTSGYVSYLRGADPLTYAKRIEKGTKPRGLLFTKIVPCKMLPFQLAKYEEAIKDKDDTLDRRSESVANFIFPGLSPDHKKLEGFYSRDGIMMVRSQLKSHRDLINRKIATDLLKIPEGDNDLIYESENGKTISGKILKIENLKYFSVKFHKTLTKLKRLFWGRKGPRTAFIYSNLVKVGIEIFQKILLQNGYLEYQEKSNDYSINNDTICYFCGKTYKEHQLNESFIIKKADDSSSEYKPKESGKCPKHTFYPATFISVTGKKTEDAQDVIQEDKQNILNSVFNHIKNKNGKWIKLVLGSRVMNEGISLANVAEVHILDVYFNLGKVDQVIGRAIRHCSHYKLIDDNYRFPHVNVYKYAVVIDNGLSSEEELYKKSESKYLLIKKVERAMKEVAIDCPLNVNGNIFPEEVELNKNCGPGPGQEPCPALCDYTRCDYKCDDKYLNKVFYDDKTSDYKGIPKEKLDDSTFTHQLARNEIEGVKKRIKELYRLKYVYTLEQIVEYAKKNYPAKKINLFKEFFVYKALDELIPITENDFNNFRDTILDKYDRSGFLIYRNKYYIFQPFDQNEDVPMYYRNTYDKNISNQLSLYNYLTSTFEYKTRHGKKKKDTSKGSTALKEDFDFYDFKGTQEYYDSRKEFNYVGIIDKEVSRRKSRNTDDLKDVFKIREKRAKILEKKRGTGIPSERGAVCKTSKDKEYLEKIAKFIKIKPEKGNTRNDLCTQIKNRLLHLEKYSTSKEGNKVTYIIIPKNHPEYPFPYNLEDRVKFILNKLKQKLKFKLDHKTKQKKKNNLATYQITIPNSKKLDEFDDVLKKLGGELVGKEWVISIE